MCKAWKWNKTCSPFRLVACLSVVLGQGVFGQLPHHHHALSFHTKRKKVGRKVNSNVGWKRQALSHIVVSSQKQINLLFPRDIYFSGELLTKKRSTKYQWNPAIARHFNVLISKDFKYKYLCILILLVLLHFLSFPCTIRGSDRQTQTHTKKACQVCQCGLLPQEIHSEEVGTLALANFYHRDSLSQ